MKRQVLVLMDRDNTLIRDPGYFGKDANWKRQFEFLPGVIQGLRLLTRHRLKTAIVANQAGIARGYFGPERVAEIHQFMVDSLRQRDIDLGPIFFCPHVSRQYVEQNKIPVDPQWILDCEDRKPRTGLLEKAMVFYGFRKEDTRVFLIGDQDSDLLAAKNFGATGFKVVSEPGGIKFIEVCEEIIRAVS